MNPWDIDPSLYASLWRMFREWYLNRKSLNVLAKKALPKTGPDAGCRA